MDRDFARGYTDAGDKMLISRLCDMYERSGSDDRGEVYTDFLDLHALSVAQRFLQHYRVRNYQFYGGYDDAERRILCFGSTETAGFPIQVLDVRVSEQDSLSHRDILGALMGLGLKREKLGDIVRHADGFYLFAHDMVAPFVIAQLDRAGRKKVHVKPAEFDADKMIRQTVESRKTVASLRMDCVVAAVVNVSRTAASELIVSGRCFLNGAETLKPDIHAVSGALLTVRGHGRFLIECCGVSKKGKIQIKICQYQ